MGNPQQLTTSSPKYTTVAKISISRPTGIRMVDTLEIIAHAGLTLETLPALASARRVVLFLNPALAQEEALLG